MRNKIFSGLLFLSTAAVIIASVLIAVIMYQGFYKNGSGTEREKLSAGIDDGKR